MRIDMFDDMQVHRCVFCGEDIHFSAYQKSIGCKCGVDYRVCREDGQAVLHHVPSVRTTKYFCKYTEGVIFG